MNDAQNHETDAAERTGCRTSEGSANSRRNAVRDGCRSISEFPVEMQKRIDAREAELCAEHQPKSRLERTLLKEMARGEIQEDVAERLLYDEERVQQAVEETWDEDQRRAANNLGARLPRDPMRVADRLLETKHGAEWLLEQWCGLAASVAENHGVTDAQRQLMFDLKGVSPLARDNTRIVPAAGDKNRLVALCAGEIQRLERRLALELEGRDKRAQAKAKHGIVQPPDAATRKYQSDKARAHKRYVWAFENFKGVRMGMLSGTLINPLTGKPLVDPEAEAGEPPPAATGGAPEPPRADAGATAAPASAAPTSAAGPPPMAPLDPQELKRRLGDLPIPLPPGLSREDQEMLLLCGGTLRSLFRAGILKPPTSVAKL
jgi:hypothetical protein